MKKLNVRSISRLNLILFVMMFAIQSVMVAAILMIPALAWAASGDGTSLERFSSMAMDVLAPVFVLFIGSFATWLLKKFQEKLHIQVSADTETMWATLARRAALRGAEWARKESKKLAEGKKVPGPQVLEVAANWALDMALLYKLPDIGREKLEGLIESELFQLKREDNLLNG